MILALELRFAVAERSHECRQLGPEQSTHLKVGSSASYIVQVVPAVYRIWMCGNKIHDRAGCTQHLCQHICIRILHPVQGFALRPLPDIGTLGPEEPCSTYLRPPWDALVLIAYFQPPCRPVCPNQGSRICSLDSGHPVQECPGILGCLIGLPTLIAEFKMPCLRSEEV